MTSSTPDALWSAPSLRVLRPFGIAWHDLCHGRLLAGCTLGVPVGVRLLIVGEPPAGPSLLLRVLAGLSRPRRGRIEVAGLADAPDGWGRRVAYLGRAPGLRAWMTPRESLRLAADLLGLSRPAVARRTEDAVAWARIRPEDLDRPIGRVGRALAERTALACALLGDPEVLLIDDALRSLPDDERRQLLRIPGPRRTVLLASRDPASEAGLVGHLALLRRGRVELLAPIRELEAVGLPLTMQGIATLAELRAAARPAVAEPAPAVATR
jgi:ABC-2 type transport system ATP-binding protein